MAFSNNLYLKCQTIVDKENIDPLTASLILVKGNVFGALIVQMFEIPTFMNLVPNNLKKLSFVLEHIPLPYLIEPSGSGSH